ncbi:hypothetical protein [Mesorhizobium sp. B2-4-17]|uniref:hypothetical protein n=1 Tax=Mesorhizobium sp. B2-4-17 TaxID=2589932 RepID=UPI0015E29FE9|nr:hypothetical protein [Mesorhizobium sp. B2-4-17]
MKRLIASRKVKVVALDLPTSWMMAKADQDDFTTRLFDAVNAMILDVLAAAGRKDYIDRRRRQAQDIARAQTEGATGADRKTNGATLGSWRC